MTDSSSSIRLLRSPNEPVGLHEELRATVGEQPDHAAEEIVKALTSFLRHTWGEDLDRVGISDEILRGVVAGDQREAWLWVLGNRTWEQYISGLRGRVLRRAKEASNA